jgi:hypothetical protein
VKQKEMLLLTQINQAVGMNCECACAQPQLQASCARITALQPIVPSSLPIITDLGSHLSLSDPSVDCVTKRLSNCVIEVNLCYRSSEDVSARKADR